MLRREISGGERDMGKLAITLDDEDLLALQEILVDEDPDAALAFLRQHLQPKIPTKGSMPCDSSRHNPYLFGQGISKKLSKD